MGSSIFLCTPHILGKLIDEFDESKKKKPGEEDTALKAARFFKENPWALVLVLVAGAGAIAGRSYCMHTAGQLIINDLRTNVFGRLLQHDMSFFDKNRVGEIVSRLSSDALVVGQAVSTNLSDGLRSLFTICGSAGLMVIIFLFCLSFNFILSDLYLSCSLCAGYNCYSNYRWNFLCFR